ncbi:nicotinate (nicotinamide) nucleotide adenylyltransferase [Mollicutes bacterium LVI A0039]|nr:nicotinate (nicotinamide) nucleotide adenylyltransferase [Mollicutes bacterium LVI A0039]
MNVCIFGSSFNPPHLAHMQIVEQLKEMGFDKVLLVPTGKPNHKQIDIATADRIDLVHAFANECQVEISFHEIENNFEYTVESLKYLNFAQSDDVYFTIGGDSLNNLPSWDYFNQLKEMVTFVIFNRVGFELDHEVLKQIKYIELEYVPIDVSSTELRANIDAKLIPSSVYKIIKERNLYQNLE